jgi:broad specificity phosphatase PhoE
MTSRITLITHAATAATRRAAFPLDELIESAPPPMTVRADEYLTSPETRCLQTAAALGLPATVDTDLRDREHGEWAGRTLDDLTVSEPITLTRWLTEPTIAPPGGESTVDLLARVSAWFDALPPDNGKVVVVTHPAIVRAAVVHAILARPESFWRIDVPPLSTTVLSGRPRTWTLRTLAAL